MQGNKIGNKRIGKVKRIEKRIVTAAAEEEDPLAWMGVTLSEKVRAKLLEKWNQLSDEQKEQMKQQWNNMSDEQKQQAVDAWDQHL